MKQGSYLDGGGRESSCYSSPTKKQPSYLAYATPQSKPKTKTLTDLVQEISATGLPENNVVMSPN